MSIEYELKIAGELELKHQHAKAVLRLLDEGATVPFIARYVMFDF